MRKGQPLPTLWMMSDERMGAAFLPALSRMPKGSGLIFRHYATPPADRKSLFCAARRIARARRMVILLAGHPKGAVGWRADGVHGGGRLKTHAPHLRTMAVHNQTEMVSAHRLDADLVLVSPVFPTRSHCGAKTLGRIGLSALARRARCPVIALGGMTPKKFKSLISKDIFGFAAIDGLLPHRR